jgi:uncharacterized protein (TIGR03435 family)
MFVTAYTVVPTLVAFAIAAPFPGRQSVSGTANTTFETVSVKPNTSGDTGPGSARLQPGGGFVATNVTLRELVRFAYQRHLFDRRDVSGGPAWVDSERFDVVAKGAREHIVDPDGSFTQTWSALRTVLAERFKLGVREQNENRQAYVLMMASPGGKPGPQLRRSEIDCGALMRGERPALAPGQGPPCGMKTPPGRLFANTVSMRTFAALLSRHLDRPVVDRTGLDGRFDIELEAVEIKAPPDYKPGPSDLALPPAAGTSMTVALREQLGLKLEPHTAPLAIVVIERAERPRSN